MSEQNQCDIMVFGAHPDDIEIGAGGLVAGEVSLGRKVVLVDLTQGEMASNGTPEERIGEAQNAADILGVSERVNLKLPDSRLTVNEECLEPVVRVIRRFKPKVLIAPDSNDRHPDHIATSGLVTQAMFISGLWKRYADIPSHRPARLFYYFLHYTREPSFVVDITQVYHTKQRAIMAHASQFGTWQGQNPTELPYLLKRIEARNGYLGSLIKVEYGEGFYSPEPLKVRDMLQII